MSTADELAAVVAGLRPLAADLALPDECVVLRPTTTKDTRNNPIAGESPVATTRCRLRVNPRMPREQLAADRVRAEALYAIDLPIETDVTPADTILVNGIRRFPVTGIQLDGDFAVFQTATAEERR